MLSEYEDGHDDHFDHVDADVHVDDDHDHAGCAVHQRADQAPTRGKSRCSNLATSVRRGLDQERAAYTVLNQLSYLQSYSCQYNH